MHQPFIDFIQRHYDGNKSAAALALGLSRSMVSRICAGERSISPAVAERIEQISGGAINRASLVWPSLKKVS